MSSTPRILFSCFEVIPGPNAISRRLSEYLRALQGRADVVVLSTKTTDNAHVQKYYDARVLRVPLQSSDFKTQVQSFERAVRRQLDSEEFDLVHFFDPYGGYGLCERRPEFGFKVAYDASSFPSIDEPLLSATVDADRKFVAKTRRQELFCLMNANAVIVPSATMQRYIVQLGVPAQSIVVIRPPIDGARFRPDVLGKPDGNPMKLIHVGGGEPWASLELIIQAVAAASRSTDVRFVVVGPLPSNTRTRLAELAKSLLVEDKIEFEESVAHDELHKVLGAGDVGVLALPDGERTRGPGSSLARLAEYAAAGRAVIATDVPVAREVLSAQTALFVPPGDVAALASAIVELANNVPRRVQLGAALRDGSVIWDGVAAGKRVLELYTALLGPKFVEAFTKHVELPESVDQQADTQHGAPPLKPAPASEPEKDTSRVDTSPALDANPLPSSVLGTSIRDDDAPVAMSASAPSLDDDDIPMSSDSGVMEVAPDDLLGEPKTNSGLRPAEVLAQAQPQGSAQNPQPVVTQPAAGLPKPTTSPLPAPTIPALPPAPGATPSISGPATSAPIRFSTSGIFVAAAPSKSSESLRTVPSGAPKAEPLPPPTIPARPARTSGAFIAISEAPPLPPPPSRPSTSSGLHRAVGEPQRSSPSGLFSAIPAPLTSISSSGIHRSVQVPPLAAASPVPSPSRPQTAPASNFITSMPMPPISAPRSTSSAVALPPPAVAPPPPLKAVPPAQADDAVLETDAIEAQHVETDVSPPASALNPWFAQLVHGYCAPEQQLFARHVPPTTMPGRE